MFMILSVSMCQKLFSTCSRKRMSPYQATIMTLFGADQQVLKYPAVAASGKHGLHKTGVSYL